MDSIDTPILDLVFGLISDGGALTPDDQDLLGSILGALQDPAALKDALTQLLALAAQADASGADAVVTTLVAVVEGALPHLEEVEDRAARAAVHAQHIRFSGFVGARRRPATLTVAPTEEAVSPFVVPRRV